MTDNADTPRTKPTDRAWLDAKKDVADRNEQARRNGKAERTERERQVAEYKRSEKGDVYR